MPDMETIPHRETALAHLAAAQATAQHINDLHRGPNVDRAEIAKGYDSIRQGLKIAEIHALLAVADAVEHAKPVKPVTTSGPIFGGQGVTL